MSDKIRKTVFSAIDDVNQLLPKNEKVDTKLESLLYAEGGKLDSLALVNLIVAIEEKIEAEFGALISLADDRAMSKKDSPFRTIRSLVNHLCVLLEEMTNGQ